MELERSTTQTTEAAATTTISWKRKYGLWALAWVGAAVVVACPPSNFPPPAILFFSWLFPLGLPGLFFAKTANLPGPELLVFGWIFYIGLSIYGLRQKSRAGFYFAYAILIILLVVNATGCRVEVANFHMGC